MGFNEFHILLKILLADYVKKQSTSKNYFIKNSDFYVFIDMSSKNKNDAAVLKIKLFEDYKKAIATNSTNNLNNEALKSKQNLKIFNFEAGVTRLERVNFENYQKYHSSKNKGLFLKEKIAKNYIFKRLNDSEIKALENKESQISRMDFFVTPNSNKNNNNKTRANFHSIESLEALETSVSKLLEDFVDNYKTHLKTYHIEAENRFLNMQNLKANFKDNKLKLKTDNLTINLLDLRINKNIDLQEFILIPEELQTEIKIVIKKQEELQPEDLLLFVMDYDNESFNYFFKNQEVSFIFQEDPYQTIKKLEKEIGFVSQGLNVNPFTKLNFKKMSKDEFLNYKKPTQETDIENLERNIKIDLRELILKEAINLQTIARLPNLNLLEKKVFYSFQHNRLLYLEDNKLKITDDNISINDAINIIEKVTGLENIEKYRKQIFKYNKPFATDAKTNSDNTLFEGNVTENMGIIFSSDNILQIDKYKERHHYDNKEFSARLKERAKIRHKKEFKAENLENDATIEEYNFFIDKDVEEKNIAYDLLKEKYGKQILDIFNYANETKFIEFLNEKTQLINLKTERKGLIDTSSGLWFAPQEMQYFVAKIFSYNKKQVNGFQMYKIIMHKGVFDKASFFNLMNVDFIRNNELPVLPYPFTLIRKSQEFF